MTQEKTALADWIFVSRAQGGEVFMPPSAQVHTQAGSLPADQLLPGDNVIARGRGYARVNDVRRVRQTVSAVWVREGFLPGCAPEGGLMLPAEQPVLLVQGGFKNPVPARDLVTYGIADPVGDRSLTLIRLRLEQPDTICAGGLHLVTREAGIGLRQAA